MSSSANTRRPVQRYVSDPGGRRLGGPECGGPEMGRAQPVGICNETLTHNTNFQKGLHRAVKPLLRLDMHSLEAKDDV
eukprot:9247882-Heterocapsa_arctica.AAC.1